VGIVVQCFSHAGFTKCKVKRLENLLLFLSIKCILLPQ
jgi:hypothetical protein